LKTIAEETAKMEISSDIIEKIKDADHILLSGASSAGKSTFLDALRESQAQLFSEHQPVIPKDWIESGMESLPPKTLFHMNMYRPIHLRVQANPKYLYSNAAAPVQYSEYAKEPVINRFCEKANGKTIAIVFLTSQEELAERINERVSIEPKFEDNSQPYDQQTWSWVAKLQDVETTLGNWTRFLKDKGIEPLFVHSTKGKFTLLPDQKAAHAIVERKELKLTEDELKHIWTNEPFEYQRVSNLVEVNASNFVQGDRAKTAEVIFKDKMDGVSLLDIGSAGGYFCFAAEKAGAQKVVGVELKDSRYRQSLLTKSLIGSKVEFRQTNMYDLGTDEKFDVVLFLNVIHHLNEPMRALELLANKTNKRMYVEFPTLTDHKFLATITLGFWSKFINHFPLIGVSLEDEQQQTFVFTKSAIERILVKNLKVFSRVEFVESHIPNRLLAICHK